METNASGWEGLHRQAKSLESRLEKKVQGYSSLAQKINANFLCDEENPLVESSDEQSLSSEIEHDLAELYECIQRMRQVNNGSLSSQQETLIKRYYEIHFDYSTEFKNTSATVQRKRESLELLHSSKSSSSNQQDSSVARLLREKMNIAASMRSLNEVLAQAFETKQTLSSQRSSLSNSSSGLGSLGTSMPGIGRLIDGIQKKKLRESIIVALVVAGLLCLTVWWVFLR